MPNVQLIPSFNAGELSPLLDVRVNLEKYQSGCRTLENFIIMPYGGVYRRPGTEYLGAAKYSDSRCRLIGFNFSTTTRFVLEFGKQYIRFWSNGAPVPNSESPLEIATPYLESELRDMQYVQINDVMYLTHPMHPAQKLSRVADDNWTIETVTWDWPAFLDENTDATTMTCSATTGTGATLTASAAVFNSSHVGAYFQIGHRRTDSSVSLALTSTHNSTAIKILGDWQLTTSQTWAGKLLLERSPDGSTGWETIRTYNGNSDRNLSITGTEETESWLRLNYTFTSQSGGANAYLEAAESLVYGIVKVTAYTSATVATVDVVKPLQAITATTHWSEGAWSDYQGYPRTVTLHAQRLMFAGTARKPLSIWGSAVDDFENFRLTSHDDAGLFFTLSSQEANVTQWMVSQTELLIGTSGDEWTLGSSGSGENITPTNVHALRQSSYGSKYLRAPVVNDVILFVQRQGRKVRELVYSYEQNGWVAPDLTVLSEHITNGELLEVAYQQQQDAIYWGITGNGVLIGMTYERDQNVVGWHRHTTGVREDGTSDVFESVATIYGTDGADEVWLAVKRTVNGETKRYIERFRTDFRAVSEAQNKADWWYLDCAKRKDGPEGLEVSGLDHLEGLSVDILSDGAVEVAKTVSGGKVTLEEKGTTVLCGLPYISTLEPMKLETQLQDGASQGRMKRVHRLVIHLYKSLGGEFSTDGTHWNWIYSRDTADLMDASPPVFTGEKEVYAASDYGQSADVLIRQSQPLPYTVLALVPKWDVYGD